MRKFATTFLVLSTLIFFSGNSVFCAEKTDNGKNVKIAPASGRSGTATAAKSLKKMTPAEIAGRIKETVDTFEEILKYIPELKKEKDDKGAVSYTYQGIKIESLDRDKLEKLYGRVRNEAVRMQTDRLNRQMDFLKRANRASEVMPASPSVTKYNFTTLPRLPQMPTKLPNVPKSPPQLPKIPQTLTY